MNVIKNTIAAAIIMSSGHHVAKADFQHHMASLQSTHLFPNADYQVDIDAATTSYRPGEAKAGRGVGTALVFPAFIQKLQQVTGKNVNVPKGEPRKVQTLYITETTNRHVDSVARGNKRNPLNAADADESLTAFYVEESTADAYFETDDDEMCLPLVEGNVVYFNGGLPHHTILKSAGAVKLVGPFLLSTLEAVGEDPFSKVGDGQCVPACGGSYYNRIDYSATSLIECKAKCLVCPGGNQEGLELVGLRFIPAYDDLEPVCWCYVDNGVDFDVSVCPDATFASGLIGTGTGPVSAQYTAEPAGECWEVINYSGTCPPTPTPDGKASKRASKTSKTNGAEGLTSIVGAELKSGGDFITTSTLVGVTLVAVFILEAVSLFY